MPPARRTPAVRPLPGSTPLPDVRTTDTRPDAVVLALPLVAVDDAVTVSGELPATGLDVPALLLAEKAGGDAGALLSLPVTAAGTLDRLLLVGTGTGSPKDLRKAGAALARRSKAHPVLVVDVTALAPDAAASAALVEGLLLASYGFTVKPGAEPQGPARGRGGRRRLPWRAAGRRRGQGHRPGARPRQHPAP